MGNNGTKQAGTQLVDLAPAEVQALAKPRDGFQAYVPPLLDLYEQNPVALRVKGLDVGTTRADLEEYDALLAAEQELEAKLAVVRKTRLLKGSNVWRATLAIYKRAESAAASDPDFLRAIAPFEKFLKHARKKRSTTVVSTSPVVPTTPTGTST